ncbi:hypothetical protein BU23DRAFT_144373 [Bimuria novae-zelandiae CBS 107.79]|uniref:Uncharacterized protein n=1 Tax=Bimuria novae-zelandiae CBS 107.79 TaxID=1447943 RepID=A0A6A5V846_9PLEO|nr:hypothetical protein BU23DRAFT_144373 [Bimuria novae-zelandiae CBS 107.79]
MTLHCTCSIKRIHYHQISYMDRQGTSTRSARSGPFRFLDLPRELRDEVYKLLLCNFKAAPKLYVNDVDDKPCGYYVRTIHPAILRVNKQLHREAYAIMVKTNRFIHCKFYGRLPFEQMLEANTQRIICHHTDQVTAFTGYTMSVSVAPEGLAWFHPEMHQFVARDNTMAVHCMILGEDCAGLTTTLSDLHMPNHAKTLDVTVAVAPYLEGRMLMEREPLDPFFNECGTQEDLLAPFRKKLRGMQNFKITGVDPTLVIAVKEDIAKDEWTDPKAVIAGLQAAKQRGNDAFKAKELRLASQAWEDAVSDVERIHGSSSWRGLVAKGDTAFIDAVVELYVLMCLNITHAQLTGTENPIHGYPPSHDKIAHLQLAEHQIDRIMIARKPNWWRKDYVWDPSEAQLAKILFRQAMCMKADAMLNYDPRVMMDALRQLSLALQIMPNDPAIKREIEDVEHRYTHMLLHMSAEEIAESRVFEDSDDDDIEFVLDEELEDDDDDDDEQTGDSDDEYADMPDLV